MDLLQTIRDMHPALGGIVIFAVAFVIGLIIRQLFFYLLNRLSTTDNDQVIVSSLKLRMKGTLFIFIPLVVLNSLLGELNISEDLQNTFNKILYVLIVISITVVAVRLIHVIQDVLFDKYDISSKDNLKARQARTQIIFLRKISTIIVVIFAIAIMMLSFDGVRKYGTTLLTSAGVAGIIIGFAAQKTIANLLAGFQIAFTQPIKIDDAVVVEGEWGWIEEINLTYVVVKIWDLRRLVLPITYFTDNPFQNWTRNSAQIIGAVYLYTDYTVSVDALRKEFKTILEGTKLWDEQISNVQVSDTNERTMTVRFLMTAVDSPTAWNLRCLVREKMIDFVQRNFPDALPRTRAELHNE